MAELKPRNITRREMVIDNYHGTQVADPYRWLEDDNAPEVQQWMAKQNEDFESYISSHPVREKLKTRFKELWHYAKSGTPHFCQGFYYTWRNDGLQNQPVLYRSTNLDDIGELVLDPNLLSTDGTVAVMTRSFSPKGNYLAYGLSSSGSDWQIIKVLDLNTKQDRPDLLQYLRFSNISWLPDESGFIYTRFPNPETSAVLQTNAKNAMVYLHTLGQDQSQDKLIHKDEAHPEWDFHAYTDEDRKWLFLRVGEGSTLPRNQLYFKPMENLDSPWLPIATDFIDGGYRVVGVVDDTAYVYTQFEAPFGKVVSIKLSETGATNWQTVIPNQDNEMLDHVLLVNNQLLTCTLNHATHNIKLHNLTGEFLRNIELPSVGSVIAISAANSWTECFIQFSSYLYPDTILRYDFKTQQISTWFSPKIDFSFEDYITIQKFCTSKDGTKVPLFITHRKDIELDGNNPTVLHGYGGFNISITPGFSIPNLAWVESGGIFVTACLRGGDEYGEAWHRAGMLESKQNVFDDFIAAGEYLIKEKYTKNGKLGIVGRSNGGLLTGACLTQRPDLFGAVAVCVPVLDMLRYHHFTCGRYWIGEYGCADNPDQFAFLYKYSPLHNVKMNTVYPPTLIMTADTDDRVVPSQARKFAATLQAADGGENPILIRIEKSAGHGQGKPISKVIDEYADMYAFFGANLK